MIVVIFGPQGSGKGTQAELMARDTGMKAFSMGEALRQEIKNGTEIGKQIQKIVSSGELVPAKITNDIVSQAINDAKTTGILLDGYPRNHEQLEFYSKNFKTDHAIELDLSEEDSIARISTRRVCPKCSKNYNIITLKPKVEGKCDVCGVDLIHREDDKPEEVKRRLEIYRKETLPMKEYYQGLGVLHVIDASKSVEDIHKKMMEILDS